MNRSRREAFFLMVLWDFYVHNITHTRASKITRDLNYCEVQNIAFHYEPTAKLDFSLLTIFFFSL